MPIAHTLTYLSTFFVIFIQFKRGRYVIARLFTFKKYQKDQCLYCHLSPAKWRAILSLKNNTDIIQQADKGGATVVRAKTAYIQKDKEKTFQHKVLQTPD